MRGSQWYCPSCGTLGSPKTYTKGHFLMEVILWCCLLVPGVLYSLWRLSSKYKGCPSCQHPGMIPADSPQAKKLQAS